MQVWDSLINAICRPYRITYKTSELLGGINGCATISRTKICRQDFVITNKRDQRLQCSFWEPHDPSVSSKKLPAVIYCHCNSGSRLDAAEAIGIVLPMGVRVFSLDFSGSGISEGDYVTLGANEVEDLSCLVDFIRAGGHTTTLALWGRSMGAVTALLYSERDPSVAGLVLDSPFSKLTDLMRELAQEQRIPLWSMVGGTALKLMRRSVRKRAGFDINNITPVEMVPRAYVPAFFGHAKEDTFVRPHHSERLHSAYAGDKEIMLFDNCDHNSPRPLDFYAASASFLARALHVYFDMQMLPSMMSETSMLMPNEAGQTHSIMPFGMLPFDSAHIPQEVEEEGTSQEMNGVAGVDIEMQQALALSLESCVISESTRPDTSQGQSSSSRQSSRTRGALKEQPFGWGSPEQKIPACAAVASTEGVVQCGSDAELTATGSVASKGSEAGAAVSQIQSTSTGGATGEEGPSGSQKELSGSISTASRKVAAVRRRVWDTAHQDTVVSSPALPQAQRQTGTQAQQHATSQPQPTQLQVSRRAVTAAVSSDQAAASGSTSVQSRGGGTATPSVQALPALASHPIGATAAKPLARSPAVSPAKRHSVLPQELAKSTKSSVWNLFPAQMEK